MESRRSSQCSLMKVPSCWRHLPQLPPAEVPRAAGSTASPSLNGAGHEPGGGQTQEQNLGKGTKPQEWSCLPSAAAGLGQLDTGGASTGLSAPHRGAKAQAMLTPVPPLGPGSCFTCPGGGAEPRSLGNARDINTCRTKSPQCGNSKVPACPWGKSKMPLDNTSQ